MSIPVFEILLFHALLVLGSNATILNMEKQHHSDFAGETSFSRNRRSIVNCSIEDIERGLLKNHTDVHVFRNDSNFAISLVWTGTKGTLLAMTSSSFGIGSSPTRLYRSTNYGRSFEDITTKIKDARILKDHGLRVSTVDTSHVILIDDLNRDWFFMHEQTTTIYRSLDSGETFEKYKLGYIMRPESLLFNPSHHLRLLVLSFENDLYFSPDFGKNWDKVDSHVGQVRWDPTRNDVIFYTRDPTGRMLKGSFDNELNRVSTDDISQKHKIAEFVHSFGIQGEFLFVSIEYLNHNGSRVMHVSKDGGSNWDAAQIPLINRQQFYSLLDMTEQMVFVHVDSFGSKGDGIIYTSDERGMIFSKSLDHHLYPNQGSLTDFYKVESLPGVYITSQLLPDSDNTIRSVITFDKGGTWGSISAPVGSVCPSTEKECKVQIHNLFSSSKGVLLPEFPKSSAAAPGIIMAHGNIGDALNLQTPNVYITSDGGYSWIQPSQLEGPHYYEIGDSGGVLFAVSSYKSTDILKFSVDQGQCWQEYKFIDKPITVTGLSVEPGLRSTVVGLWGWEKGGDNAWRAVTIEFGAILKNPCRDDDYETWQAHESNEKFLNDDACLLGKKAVFKRRKKGTVCTNGKNFKTEAIVSVCQCTKADYMCDYGYARHDSGDCVTDPDYGNTHRDICVGDEEETIQTQGYRKIPGDKCNGGFEPHMVIKSLHKNCIEFEVKKEDFGVKPEEFEKDEEEFHLDPDPPAHLHNTDSQKSSSSTGLIVILILTVIGLVVVLVYVTKKRWASHLRVKYSPLNIDDNSGMPDVKLTDGSTNLMENGVSSTPTPRTNLISPPIPSYHDDSDEDLLVT